MGEVELQIVRDAESVSKDGLRDKGVDVVVVCRVLSEEAGSWGADALAGNLELEDHLFPLTCTTEEEVLFAVGSLNVILAPALVHVDLRLVRDLKLAGVCALRVIDINRNIYSFACIEKALANGDSHLG